MHHQQLHFPFTHAVTARDIAVINELRFSMSTSLTLEGIRQDRSGELRKKLHEILSQPRKPVNLRRRPVLHEVNYGNYTAGEQMLLRPILPYVSLQPLQKPQEDDYDSDEDDRDQNRKIVAEIRSRFIVQGITEKQIACASCLSGVCELPSLRETDTPGRFMLTRFWGMAYPQKDDASDDVYVVCANKHRVGFIVDDDYFVDADSPLVVLLPGGGGGGGKGRGGGGGGGGGGSSGGGGGSDTIPWTPKTWSNNFAQIGGPTSPAPQETPITEASLFCVICSFQASSKKTFFTHIASSSHRREEQYFIERGDGSSY